MTENKQDPVAKAKADFDKINEKISEKAAAGVDKDFLKDKQNLVGKRLLRLLAFQIFLLVADADGKTDKKEFAEFKDFLNQRQKHCSNPYTRRMFHSTIVNYSSLINRYLGGHIKKDLEMVGKAMDYVKICASTTVTAEICDDLRALAKAIAEASGGFIGMTSSVSPEERSMLKKLDDIFDNAIANAAGDDKPQNDWID